MRTMGGIKKAKKKEKKQDVRCHVFAQTTHVARRPPKLAYGVGSRTSPMSGFNSIGSGISARVEFPIFLLIFAWALQLCSEKELPEITASVYNLVTAKVRK